MKKSIRILAAAMAVSAVMTSCSFGSIGAFAADEPAAVTSTAEDLPLLGGWQINSGKVSMKNNPAAYKAFKKATKEYTGMTLTPIALLGTQVVAGTNYCILCRTKAVVPDAQPQMQLVYIYEDLQGNAEITGFKTIIGELLPGGFSANSGKLGMASNKKVYKLYKKAIKGLAGVDYTPMYYLGSQVVAGTNHLIICRSKVVYPGAPYKFSLVTIYEDLKGKAQILDIEDLTIGDTDETPAAEEEVQEGPSVGIANPWSKYKTVKAASKAAGVEFAAPDSLGKYKTVYIQAMKGIVEVNYSNGKKDICARKGTGTDDISGDYEVYEKTVTEKISGVDVTLRMNGKKVGSAIWNDGTNSYSYFVRDGIARSVAIDHISQLIGK